MYIVVLAACKGLSNVDNFLKIRGYFQPGLYSSIHG